MHLYYKNFNFSIVEINKTTPSEIMEGRLDLFWAQKNCFITHLESCTHVAVIKCYPPRAENYINPKVKCCVLCKIGSLCFVLGTNVRVLP
jgi:hypothetical protein